MKIYIKFKNNACQAVKTRVLLQTWTDGKECRKPLTNLKGNENVRNNL
nr:MAG TPA: hypothetical protein [Caudoviricetes sp.]